MLSPSAIRTLCDQYGLRPSSTFGQNYLLVQSTIDQMIEAAGLTGKETVVEVGPGFGALTHTLSGHAARVVAFEIEQTLRPYWRDQAATFPNVELVWGDVLKQWNDIAPTLPPDYVVVANLPYQITSRVIRTFLSGERKPSCMVIMVQKEVAQRICARAGEMSVLSVSVQCFGQPRIVTHVPRGQFWPAPDVDSAVIAIEHIQDRPQEDVFFRYVKAGFSSRRKQLWRNISSQLGLPKAAVQTAIHTATGNEKIRAQELTVAQWWQVVEALNG